MTIVNKDCISSETMQFYLILHEVKCSQVSQTINLYFHVSQNFSSEFYSIFFGRCTSFIHLYQRQCLGRVKCFIRQTIHIAILAYPMLLCEEDWLFSDICIYLLPIVFNSIIFFQKPCFVCHSMPYHAMHIFLK